MGLSTFTSSELVIFCRLSFRLALENAAANPLLYLAVVPHSMRSLKIQWCIISFKLS